VKKKIISVCLMAASIGLMALPYGVRMDWGLSSGATLTTYESYFSGLPLGYANWFPIITVGLSIAAILLILVGRRSGVLVCLSICLFASLGSWFVFNASSVIGAIIFVLHAAVLVIQIVHKKIRADIESAPTTDV